MALVGINNENEFYSNHYLGEVFTSDIRDVLEPWIEQENAAREAERAAREKGKEVEAGYRAPWNQLYSLATEFFRKLTEHEKQRQIPQRLADQRSRWQPLLKALGYELNPHIQMLDDDTPLPVLARYNSTDGSPWLWIVEAHDQEEGTLDPLALSLLTAQFPVDTDKHKRDSLRKKANGEYRSWQDLFSTVVFTQNEPPRFVLLLGNRQLLLLDRTKWAQNRLLRFDFEEILSRRETDTLKATSVLLHKDSLLPGSGAPYLDSLDDNSHKHAFGVSEDLKYALRESIELLGNEAMRYLINNELAYYTGKRAINPDELSRECLRYMYRLLFLFYIEARPELGYAPMTAKTYLQGYSLETLRDLEMIPLTNEEDRNGRYFHDSLNMLFKLVRDGYSGGVKMQSDLESGDQITIHSHQFSVPRLESHLFEANNTRILNRVVFRNETLQQIIQAMSLSRPGSGRLEDNSTYLKLRWVMDYWCALWFWPIDKADELPDRGMWLMEMETLLDGIVVTERVTEAAEQATGDLFADEGMVREESSLFSGAGRLKTDVLFRHLPRLAIVDALKKQHRFFHWDLEFSDLFAERGGFDLMLGNPPWLRVEWQEAGVLGDFEPEFVLRKLSASKLATLRIDTFNQIPALEEAWRSEYEGCEGMQNFLNAQQNYAVLAGQKANLYKCFLPQAWRLGARKGVAGFLHPEGIYDDPKGGQLRASVYPRLRAHFQFQNELNLFVEVDHHAKFSSNIYSASPSLVGFEHISNLYTPQTIDACFDHSGGGEIPGIKDEIEYEGKLKVVMVKKIITSRCWSNFCPSRKRC